MDHVNGHNVPEAHEHFTTSSQENPARAWRRDAYDALKLYEGSNGRNEQALEDAKDLSRKAYVHDVENGKDTEPYSTHILLAKIDLIAGTFKQDEELLGRAEYYIDVALEYDKKNDSALALKENIARAQADLEPLVPVDVDSILTDDLAPLSPEKTQDEFNGAVNGHAQTPTTTQLQAPPKETNDNDAPFENLPSEEHEEVNVITTLPGLAHGDDDRWDDLVDDMEERRNSFSPFIIG